PVGSRHEVRRRTRIRRDRGGRASETVARRVRGDAVDDARGAVAEHVVPGERPEGATRERTADQAGAERAGATVQVREDRVDIAGPLAPGGQRALAVRPAVVAAGDPEVDLLDRQVADVPRPELPGGGGDAHRTGGGDRGGPARAARPRRADERVVGGDRPVEIEPQELPVERGEILGVRVRGKTGAPAVAEPRVADANVEFLVG